MRRSVDFEQVEDVNAKSVCVDGMARRRSSSFLTRKSVDQCLNILQKQEEMHRVGRGRDEIEMFVECARLFVLGVNSKGTDARNVSCLQGPKKSILQQGLSYTAPLVIPTNSKAGQEHDRDGMWQTRLRRRPACDSR